MAHTVNVAEDYSIRTLTGDAELSSLVLTGWGAITSQVTALYTYTNRGRMWWNYTASSGAVTVSNKQGGTSYLTGTASAGLVTLSQANSSGLSGTLIINNGTPGTNPAQNSTGDFILSYADENDLVDVMAGVASYLDSNSKWQGQLARFEAILKRAKRELDEHIFQKLAGSARRDARGRRVLADIADPRQLASVHANYTAMMIEQYRGNRQPVFLESAREYERRWHNLLGAMTLELDHEADGQVDAAVNMTSTRLVLG